MHAKQTSRKAEPRSNDPSKESDPFDDLKDEITRFTTAMEKLDAKIQALEAERADIANAIAAIRPRLIPLQASLDILGCEASEHESALKEAKKWEATWRRFLPWGRKHKESPEVKAAREERVREIDAEFGVSGPELIRLNNQAVALVSERRRIDGEMQSVKNRREFVRNNLDVIRGQLRRAERERMEKLQREEMAYLEEVERERERKEREEEERKDKEFREAQEALGRSENARKKRE
jgi:hypothetical protein